MTKTVKQQNQRNRFKIRLRHFLEGMGSVLEIMPPPYSRKYRPQINRTRIGSLQKDQQVLSSDRMKVRKDFRNTVKSMKQGEIAKGHERT